jgi:hypothetical protein
MAQHVRLVPDSVITHIIHAGGIFGYQTGIEESEGQHAGKQVPTPIDSMVDEAMK